MQEESSSGEGFWSGLFDLSPLAVGLREVVGADVVHLADNRRMAALFGRGEGELTGRSDGELGVDPERVARSITRYRVARAEGRPQRCPIAVEGRVLHHVEGVVAALPGDGASERYLVVGCDVGEVRALHDRLAEGERVAALHALAGSLAHAVVDPASYALLRVASAERALEGHDLSRVRRDLAAIREGLDQVIEAVRKPRVVAPPSRSVHPVVVADILEEVIPLATGRLRDRGKVVLALQPAPLVMADRTALAQALVLVIRGALQAAGDEGSIRVALGTRGGAAEVAVVAEEGAFDDRLLEKPEPFASPWGDDDLGLYLARAAVETLGGSLSLANDRGARATVLLPGAPAVSA